MPTVKYEQIPHLSETDEAEVLNTSNRENYRWTDLCVQKTLLTAALILLYFSLSIGLTFYQRWLLQDFHYPLTVVTYHLIIKWLLSICVRTVIYLVTGKPQLVLPLVTCLRSVFPTGVASGIDVGFSNWGLELVTISLYTMTKSSTIIFILGFAIFLGLEKKSWSLVGIIVMISSGLIMFTYKATQFNLLGFNLLLIASFSAGLRWTFTQMLMQKAKLGLHNPIDMVFHVQPSMLLSILPFMAFFEGFKCIDYLRSLPVEQLVPMMMKVSVGATIAFAMELSEFLVVTYTSSLTLSLAGIFKEMCILVLAVEVNGDILSPINGVGLAMCMIGISGHIIHKVLIIKATAVAASTLTDEQLDEQLLRSRDAKRADVKQPYRDRSTLLHGETTSDDSDMEDSNHVIYEVLKRRENAR